MRLIRCTVLISGPYGAIPTLNLQISTGIAADWGVSLVMKGNEMELICRVKLAC